MTPERWQRVHEVFSAALDVDAQRRDAEVREACAEDTSLQAEVLELLASHEKAAKEGFLELPPWSVEEVPVTLPDFDGYEQIEFVGHGGMGVVYRAFQHSLDRWVALKMSLPSRLAADDDPHRFRAEAESMAKLHHANIVRVHDVGDHDGRPYFCMELVDGESLALQLSRFRDEPRASAQLLATVARAVQHAHLRGLLHRDLKPENILIDEEGQPHVSDFGLAKRVDDADTPPGIVGTAGYMSPEQADPEQDETVLSDVYGLGAIFYALLTGRAPHRGSDYLETLQLVRERSPASPRALNPKVDRDLETICLKCLSHDAQQRYPSAGALAEDLGRWLEGRETVACPWSRRQRWRAWMRRNPRLGWLGATTAVLLALATTLVVKDLVAVAQEPALAQQALAQHQADVIGLRIKQLVQAVDMAATEASLARAIARQDPERLQSALVAIGVRATDLGGTSPFDTWIVLNLEGKIIARWPQKSAEQATLDFSQRDYFKGALALSNAPGGPRAYVSRAYFATVTHNYKFGIGRALMSEGKPVGVIMASVTTSPMLGLPMAKDRASKTALVVRTDASKISSRHPERPAKYVLLMHPAYRRGTEPLPFSSTLAQSLEDGVNDEYVDPAAAIDPALGGTWLAGMASVEGTEFFVVSQRRYAAGTALKWWGVVVAAGLFALALLWRLARRGRRLPGA